MKITGLDIFLLKSSVPKGWKYPVASFVSGGSFLLRVKTDEGIVGWGEPSAYGATVETMMETLSKELRAYLIGKDPFDVERLVKQDETKSKHEYGAAAWSSAMAGASQALWDIIGKYKNKPLYKLLNRKNTASNKVLTYASGGMIYEDSSFELLIEEVLAAKEQGFSSWKFRPPSPVNLLSHFERNKNPPAIDTQNIILVAEKLRATVGDNFDLMLDIGCRIKDRDTALKIGKVLDELNFRFFEEPVKREVEEYTFLSSHLTTPIAIGECFFSAKKFEQWIKADALEILQPDANYAGINEILSIADLAKKHNKEIILHNWTNAVSMAANAHLAASMPECTMLEYSITYNPMRSELINIPFKPQNGELIIPDTPGLGIEIDEKCLSKFCHYKDLQVN